MNTFHFNIINIYGEKGKAWLGELPAIVCRAPSNLKVTLQPSNFLSNLPQPTINEIDRIWEHTTKKRNNQLFNGKILSVIQKHPDQITATSVQYKYFLAQLSLPELFNDLQIKPLAVSGLLDCTDGIVWGRRNKTMTQDREKWELVPSGGINIENIDEPISKTINIDYRTQIYSELQEEIGIKKSLVLDINTFCLVQDNNSHVLDIGIHIKTALNSNEIIKNYMQNGNREYTDINIIPQNSILDFIEKNKTHISATSLQIMALYMTKNL